MKKLIAIIGLILLVTLTNVEACSPAFWYPDLFIVFDECSEDDFYNDDFDFKVYIKRETVNEDLIIANHDEEWLDVFEDIDISDRYGFDYYTRECTMVLSHPSNYGWGFDTGVSLLDDFMVEVYYKGHRTDEAYFFSYNELWGDERSYTDALAFNTSNLSLSRESYEYNDPCSGTGNPMFWPAFTVITFVLYFPFALSMLISHNRETKLFWGLRNREELLTLNKFTLYGTYLMLCATMFFVLINIWYLGHILILLLSIFKVYSYFRQKLELTKWFYIHQILNLFLFTLGTIGFYYYIIVNM